jgi:hypothetical protein
MHLQLFPNPANDYLIVKWEIEEASDNILIRLTSYSGKTLMEIPVIGNQDQKVIDTRHLKPGIYVVSFLKDARIIGSKKITIIK